MKVLRMGAALAGGLLITAFAGASLLPMSSASAVGPGEAAHVRAAPGWLSIRAGGLYTCGIRTDHTLWCWGQNDVGQLGLGDTKKRATPSQVGHRTDWAGLAAGFDHTCATRTDHSLWCWGSGRAGQLGLGEKGGRTAPSRVGADTNWTSVVAGYTHTCGIRTDHTLWCWGGDSFAGQLGLGDHTDRSRPTQVGTRTDWAVARAGDSHTCATRINHTLWCWGNNASGQLGLGDLGNRSRPTQVGKRTDWADLGAGDGYHTCALRTNHTLWCWGFNGSGQLGLGDTNIGQRPRRSAPRATGTASTPATSRPAQPVPTTPCGAGGSTTLDRSESATRLTGPSPLRSAPAPTGQRSVPRRPPHLRPPQQPHPVVLGIQRPRPARGRRPRGPLGAHAGLAGRTRRAKGRRFDSGLGHHPTVTHLELHPARPWSRASRVADIACAVVSSATDVRSRLWFLTTGGRGA